MINQAQSRHIEMLGDIRNKCDHPRCEEPIKDEIQVLIDGVSNVIKSIY